jgi:hypothetical protein
MGNGIFTDATFESFLQRRFVSPAKQNRSNNRDCPTSESFFFFFREKSLPFWNIDENSTVHWNLNTFHRFSYYHSMIFNFEFALIDGFLQQKSSALRILSTVTTNKRAERYSATYFQSVSVDERHQNIPRL